MKKVEMTKQTKLVLEGIEGFMIREVTPFGTSGKLPRAEARGVGLMLLFFYPA